MHWVLKAAQVISPEKEKKQLGRPGRLNFSFSPVIFWVISFGVRLNVDFSAEYCDHRFSAFLRFLASDFGVIQKHGNSLKRRGHFGAPEVIVYARVKNYYLHSEGAGRKGSRACLATCSGLVNRSHKNREIGLPHSKQ